MADHEPRWEVESLLAHASGAAGFLSSPAVAAGLSGDSGSLVGRRLGQYTVRASLGAGGMGQVYRAHDTMLGRDVAIKILPRIFSIDPDRRARFDREARLLVALNHPHIGAILAHEPEWALLPTATPPHIRHVIGGAGGAQHRPRRARLPAAAGESSAGSPLHRPAAGDDVHQEGHHRTPAIWRFDLSSGSSSRLTFTPGVARFGIDVHGFGETRGKWQVSTAGGSQPVWRGDGNELFHVGPDGRLFADAVSGDRTCERGIATPLFQTALPPMVAPFRTGYAVAADGQRFLLNNLRPNADASAITIVLNAVAHVSPD